MAESPLSIIKSYLVSLGFSVDKSSYDTATKAIDSAGESLAKLAGGAVKQFGLATAAVTSFVTTAIVGMAKFLNDLGNAQIQYEMLARQMWTTQQNAEAFSTTLKAMGRSLNDLYLSPTLMAQFQQLNKQAFEMMPPAEYQEQMKFIQGISFQFTRMKLEGTYALQWIGYYFVKYMSGPLNSIYNTLTHLNDIIIKTMPYWTKVVAEVLSWFAQFGVTTVEAIKDVAQAFNDIGQSIPNNIKLVGLALLGLLLIMNQGPLGWIIDGFVALGLALNDFFTYIHGGQSEFGQFWQKLIDLYNYLKDSGAIDSFKNGFKTAMKDISNWINDTIKDIKSFWKALKDNGTINDLKESGKNIAEIFQKLSEDISGSLDSLGEEINKSKVLTNLGKSFEDLMQSVANVTQAVTDLINKILGLKGTKAGIKQVGDWINNFILNGLDAVLFMIKEIASGLNGLADLLQGKWGDALKNFKDMFGKDATTNVPNYLPSNKYSKQSSTNTSHVTVNTTQNIYGSSDPHATASAAASNLTTVLRNTKGVIV
jgi:gas vesicle protein